MNVLEIIREKLKIIGAAGLCRDGCGCGIDDLVCCESDPCFCVPAKKAIATESGECHDVGDEIYIEHNPPNPRVDRAAQPLRSNELLDGIPSTGETK